MRRLQKPKDFIAKSSFSSRELWVFGLVFFGLGAYVLYRSFAAGPLVASLQAEQMSLPAGASVITDASASGGKAMQLLSNGTASGTVSLPSASDSLVVMARGDQCQGSPLMSMSLDGKAVLSNVVVGSTGWSSFTASPSLTAGSHAVTITFSGDYQKTRGHKSCDRNLYVDVSNFYGPTPAPTPAPTVALSASPTSLTAGQAATLTWNSTDASSCTASGAWSGAQPTSGSTSTGALNTNSTYTLTCTGAGGSASTSATITVTAVTPPPTSGTPSGYNWIGDFRNDSQDFSAFDTHDAQLSLTITDPTFGSIHGSTIVAKRPSFYSSSNYSARMVTSNSFNSSSTSGAATVLWQPGGNSSAWMQRGAKTWFRMAVLFPNGSDSNYPGNFTVGSNDGVGSSWHQIMEWHINAPTSGAPGSTNVGTIYGPSNASLGFFPSGGLYGNWKRYYIPLTNQVQTKANSGAPAGTIQSLQYNHWYDVVVYQVMDPDPAVGYAEWWVDGQLRFADHVATMPQNSDGSVPGVGFEAGNYRNYVSGQTNDTIYMTAMVAGPSKASIGE
jgi:hypothetical protein